MLGRTRDSAWPGSAGDAVDYLEIKGERLPALGFGTAGLGGPEGTASVLDALEIGYRHLDTAQAYGNEAEVGEAVRRSGLDRSEVFLTTKLRGADLAGDRVGPATEASLRALGVDQIDLLLIHGPSDEIPMKVTLDAMVEQVRAGRVRHIGVSNFPTAMLREAMGHAPIFTDQVPYQVGRTQRGVAEVARTDGLLLTAYSPLRGEGLDHEAVRAAAGSHGKSARQVALRWLLQQPNVSPIPRSGSSPHRRENFEVFDFQLSDDEMARITAIAGR